MRRTVACAIGWLVVVSTEVGVRAGSPVTPDIDSQADSRNTTGGVVAAPCTGNLIAEGKALSPTFADLAARLEQSDVVATVECTTRNDESVSGYVMFVTRTPLRRYVRVYFDIRLGRRRAIAVVGHELAHALEIAAHPEVVDARTMRGMYAKVGYGHGDRWDSPAGPAAEDAIQSELSGTPPRR